MTVNTPQPFVPGYRLEDGSELNARFAAPLVSTETGITASTTHTLVGAYQLHATISVLTVVATAADSVKLPPNQPIGRSVKIINAVATAAAVYPGEATSTINGGSAGASVSLPASSSQTYTLVAAGTWRAG